MCVSNRFNPAWKECHFYLEQFENYCQDFLSKGVASKISKQMIKNIKKLTKIHFMIYENINNSILTSLTYKRCINKLNRLDEKESNPVEENSVQLIRKSDILLFDEKEMLSIRYMEKDDDIISYSDNDIEFMKYYSDKASVEDLKEGSFEYFIQNFDIRDKLKIFVSFKPKGLPVLARIKNNKVKRLLYLTKDNIIEINPSVLDSRINIKEEIPDCIIKLYLLLPFKHLNDVSIMGDKKYKNPSDAIKTLFVRNPDERKMFYRYIEFIPYDILIDNQDYFDSSRKDKLDLLKSLNFKYSLKTFVLEEKIGKILDKFEEMIDFLIDERYELPYEIQGVIIEPSKKSISRVLGIENGIYNFRMLYKLPSAMKETEVNGMDVSIGHTGKISCVVYYKPVKFEGRTFDHSAIGSATIFEKLRLKRKDRIKIFYSNDHLATIFSNIDRDNEDGKYLKFPKECPKCHCDLELKGSNYYCINLNCPEIIIRKITNFINRLKISYLSYDGVVALYELKQVRKYSDIFNMEGLILSRISNFGMKKANRVKEEISILKERKVSEPELLYALSIDNLGPKAAELICSKFSIRDLLYKDNYEFLYKAIPSLRGYKIDFSFLQKHSKDIDKVINILLKEY